MKKLLLIFVLCVVCGGAFGQEEFKKSVMNYVYSFDEAIVKAKEENKLIFFNCYADWVVTYRSMDHFVFSDAEFAEFMDKNFVNLFLDVTLPENKFLVDKYDIRFFMHFLVLDSEGDLVHRIVGGSKLPEFKNNISLALNPKTSLRGMEARYEKEKGKVDFLRDYIKILKMAGYEKEQKKVEDEFFAKISQKDWLKKENWSILKPKMKEEGSDYFKFLLENKDKFVKISSIKEIDGLITSVFFPESFYFANGKTEYNANAVGMYRIKVNKANLPEDNIIFKMLHFAKLRGEKKYSEMLAYFKEITPTLDEQTIDYLAFSLKEIRDYAPEDKKVIIDYLTTLSADKKGSTLREYTNTISLVEEFRGIDFFNGTFADACEKARKENKLIFLDAYTSWCGPCKTMSAQVFTRKDVGLYFNETFINCKIDMEKGEGPELAKKYGVTAYPTLLLIDGNGKLVHKCVGGSDAKSFMERIKRGTVEQTSYRYLKENFDEKKEDINFHLNYLIAMGHASEEDASPAKISALLMSAKEVRELAKPEIVDYILTNITDYRDRLIVRLVENASVFSEALGVDQFNKVMERFYFPQMIGYFSGEMNQEMYKDIRKSIETCGFPKESSLNMLITIGDLYGKKDMNAVLAYYNDSVSKVEDGQTKLNIDLLLKYMLKSCTIEQQNVIREYVKRSEANCDPRAKNGYKSLMESIAN